MITVLVIIWYANGNQVNTFIMDKRVVVNMFNPLLE
jgi:hypothetical protein